LASRPLWFAKTRYGLLFVPIQSWKTLFPTPIDGFRAADGKRLTLNLTPESINQVGTSPGTEERPQE
jgi:hypothetical protein